MKISLNEIKKYVDVPKNMSTEELVRLIGARLVEVEGTEDLAPKYEGITVVKVAECEKIPETHLTLCQVDDGSGELTQVVCGAPNVHKGMLTAWIRPGAIVPVTYGNEDFRLSVRKLRGYESNGMLAAADELDLGDSHEGIVEIEPELCKPGDSLIEAFGLDDVILDIENKSLTHRPDCFGIIGFAREVSGILGLNFVNPRFTFPSEGGVSQNLSRDISITIDSSDICGKYCCAMVEVDGVAEKNKYFTLDDVFLAKAGMRSISKIVDVTNILMLLTGQPLHAFDYDKFVKVGGGKTAKVGVRLAKDGEELQLLDGKTINCDKNDILITSNDIPVALAGAMGGASTEIDASTKRVLIESATFSLYHLRKTQMKHGIFSEAITRFTKGQPAGNALPVLLLAIEWLFGNTAQSLDEVSLEGIVIAEAPKGNTLLNKPIRVSVEQINDLLGTEYDDELCKRTLANVGFEVGEKNGVLTVTAPYWRTDIHIPEDIIEEVGRLNGFDNIPKTLAMRPFVGAKIDSIFALKTKLRGVLADIARAHEVLTYSFVSKELQEKVLEDPKKSYEIVNSLSPELQVFRQSLMPSLLDKVYDNLKAGYKEFALFEMNQVTDMELGKDADGVPEMKNHLALVVVGNYYEAKVRLEVMMRELGVDWSVREEEAIAPYFEKGRSAEVMARNGNGELIKVGAIGEVKARVRKNLKLEPVVAGFEISLDELVGVEGMVKKGFRLSKFPTVARDVTVRATLKASYAEVKAAIGDAIGEDAELTYKIEDLSIYQKDEKTKNLSFHLEFANMRRTMTTKEIEKVMERVAKQVKKIKGEIV